MGRLLAIGVLLCVGTAGHAPLLFAAITPDDPGPSDVLLSIDTNAAQRPISPYIYGSNSSKITHRTFDRSGGNRMTGHNWETNASNAGADYFHHSDYFLTDGQAGLPPGSAVRGMLEGAAANGRGALVTVPMAGYVSADANGTVEVSETAPSARWHEVVPNKASIYPGSSLSLDPDTSDSYVFTDEFVHWAETTNQPGQPVFYSLDNEPALWGPEGRTHPRLHSTAATFAEMREKTIAHASAIKDVNPDALVFGGVGYGWLEAVSLQQASDAVTIDLCA